jgi:hypothetical protein
MFLAQADLGITANPARDVIKLKPKRKGGFPRWKPADPDKFEARFPTGRKARLALALLMFTGARRSDLVRLVGHICAMASSLGCLTTAATRKTR